MTGSALGMTATSGQRSAPPGGEAAAAAAAEAATSGPHKGKARAAGAQMSQISGVKKPLTHTNSLTKLPKYGIETPHEVELGKLLEDVDKWGLDIFRVNDLSCNHPLTTVMYRILRVSPTTVTSHHPASRES